MNIKDYGKYILVPKTTSLTLLDKILAISIYIQDSGTEDNKVYQDWLCEISCALLDNENQITELKTQITELENALIIAKKGG